MIDNKVRYEIDGSGAFIGQTIGSVRALTDYTTTIELVSPLPRDTSVMVNFLVYDARNIDLPLFMIPSDKKGWQVSNNPLVADWNVWEVGIDQTALAAISKYRAGRIGVSFTFRERRPSKNALNYKGIFDEFNQLPLVGENDGDYYVCRGYNITVSGTLYTYNDNSVWQTDKWVRDRNMRIILTTTTIDLPVDPALLANVPDVPAQDIADLIAQWGGGFVDMESHINDADIHVSPIDRDFWDGMLPRDGSELMEGHLNMAGYDIYDVTYISVETTETHEINSYHDAIKVLKRLDLTNKDLINIARVLANYVEALSVKTDHITSDSAQIGVNKDLDLGGNKIVNVNEIKVDRISANDNPFIEVSDDIDMNGKGVYGVGEVEGEIGTFNISLTKGGKEVATIEYVDNKDTDKLDKIWTDLTNQTTSFLTDEFVLNRGNSVYKTTLATMLSNVVATEIFIVVQELPEIGQINKIYLVPKGTPEAQNTYDEFIWVNSAWENLGTITLDLSNYYNKTEVNGLLSAKVDKNNAITAGTKAKITYDAKGLVTGGADLVATDIPQLAPSKITQDANNRFVTDTEKSTWNGKQNALTAGNNITIVGNVISATSGGGGGYDPDGETIALNSNDELEATNVAIWRYV